MITGSTALLALAGLAVFGGGRCAASRWCMMFGIVIGTYSSIYVAAPIILLGVLKRGEDAEVIKPQPSRV